MKKFYFLVFLITLLTLKTTYSFSQAGILDASFGNGGKIITPVGDSSSVANSVVITSDGKIVVGGSSFIAGNSVATILQYNSDGTVDTTFGTKGKVILSNAGSSSISSISIQPDGKIVAGGYSGSYPSNFLIARYNKNGTLDNSFGNYGIVLTSYNSIGVAGGLRLKKIIIKPNGTIIAGGLVSTFTLEVIPVITQYLSNGTIDSSFGINGWFISSRYISINPYFSGTFVDAVNDIATTTDGKILSVLEPIYPSPTGFIISRLLVDGKLDSSFGINGSVNIAMNDSLHDEGQSIVPLPDGSFVVTGSSYPGPPTYETSIGLIKYHPDGSLDSTFGINGRVLTHISGFYTYGNHILSLPDGSLLVSGYNNYPNRDFVLAKYHPNGTLDSSFGTNGITTTDFSNTDDISYSSALQPDGKIVLAGSTGSSTNYNIALARYNNATIYPLQLLSFTATKKDVVNLLQWQTAQEMNINLFEVQRSSNGKDYNTIGSVKAGSIIYHFTDNQPLLGSNYYRLKMVDRNGVFTYSNDRLIINSQSLIVKIYPNPVKSNLKVQIDNNEEATLQWQVISADGKVLMSGQWQVQAGNNAENMHIAALSKGIYYLVITAKSSQQKMIRFEKF